MNTVKRSRQQEDRGAARYGGSRNAGSGNQWLRKNDVRTARFSIEYKRTDARSISVKLDDLLTAEKHAVLDDREMVFGIELGGRHWVLVSEETFDTLLDEGVD